MTYLEVRHEGIVKRWPIEGLPTGKTEADYNKRIEKLNEVLANYSENMAYAFSDKAKISIIHVSNFEPWHEQQAGDQTTSITSESIQGT